MLGGFLLGLFLLGVTLGALHYPPVRELRTGIVRVSRKVVFKGGSRRYFGREGLIEGGWWRADWCC